MPKSSSSRRKVLEAIHSSIQEVFGRLILLAWLVAIVAGGWFLYQRSRPEGSGPTARIESRSAPLIGALEKYQVEHGEYPKLLRDLAESPAKFGLDYIYNGENPTPNGYRSYGLLVVSDSKTYAYSSSEPVWRERAQEPER